MLSTKDLKTHGIAGKRAANSGRSASNWSRAAIKARAASYGPEILCHT
jgi:hypothetical protein